MIFPVSPMAAVAIPKNMENTTICKTSLLAKASKKLSGNTWVIKFSNVIFFTSMPVSAPAAGKSNCIILPGFSKFTAIKPVNNERIVAK